MKRYFYILPIFLQSIVYIISYIIFKIFLNLKIKGRENLKYLNKGLIVVSNHTNELDIILVRIAFPFFSKISPMYYVTHPKKYYSYDIFKWRSFLYGSGFFFKIFGGYPSRSGQNDYNHSLKDHIKILENGGTICIFPEGKVIKDESSTEPRGGVAFLTFRTGAPVLPIRIEGLKCLTFKDFLFRKRKVVINIGKPMMSSEVVKSEKPELVDFKLGARTIMDRITLA